MYFLYFFMEEKTMKKRILVALSAVLVAVMLVATVSAASFDDVK